MGKQGFLADAELTVVQSGLRLLNVTARAYRNMLATMVAEKVALIYIVAPGGAYRSRQLTLAMRANPRAYGVTPGILPQIPGPHELGLCTDLGGNWQWVVKNGHRWGFVRPARTIAMGDLNHFQHDGVTVGTAPAGSVGSQITPNTPSTPKEDTLSAAEVQEIKNFIRSQARGQILDFRETADGGKTVTGDIFFRSPERGIIRIRNEFELGLLVRYLDDNGDVMFAAETALINYYLVLPVPGSTVVDTAPLQAFIREEIAKLGKGITVDSKLSPEQLQIISAAVNDEFARRAAS